MLLQRAHPRLAINTLRRLAMIITKHSTQPFTTLQQTLKPPGEIVYESPPEIGLIRCQKSLGGLLRHYDRVAA